MLGPGKTEQPVAREPDRDQHQYGCSERLLEESVQRFVESSRLLRAVGQGGVQEQRAYDRDRNRLAEVADLAERHIGVAVLAGLAVEIELRTELLGPAT